MHQNDFPRTAFSSLLASYGRHFEYAILETELRAFYHSNELTCLFPHELLDMLLSTRRFKAMPQVTKLCELVLTVPATTASVERSFSALKRIKTASRNTMGQGRLSSLSLLSIEKELLASLYAKASFHDEVIDKFAAMKERRIDLIFK